MPTLIQVVSDGTTITVTSETGVVIASGQAGIDDSVYISAAITNISAGGSIRMRGQFVCTSQVPITKSVSIIGEPGTAITYNTLGTPLIYGYSPSITYTRTLTADAPARASSVTVSSTSSISADQLILIYDNAVWNSTDYPAWKTGELHKIKSVSGNVITFVDTLVNGYTVANSAKCKAAVTPAISIRDIVFQSANPTGNSRAVSLYFCKDSAIEACSFSGFGMAAISLEDCYNTAISKCNFSGSEMVGYGYGVSINDSCAFTDIYSNYFQGCRHCVTHGGYNEAGQPRETLIRGNTMIGVADVAVLDAHPIVESILISDNIIITPNTNDPNLYIGAKHAIITGNRLVGGSLTPRGNLTGCNWIITNNQFLNSGYGFKTNYAGYTWNQVSFIGNIAIGGNLITIGNPSPIATLVQL